MEGPQESLLGRLLFFIYINDLPCNIPNLKIVLFGNNTIFIGKCHSIDFVDTQFASATSNAEVWFIAQKLKLNVNKTHNMVISNKSIS